MKSGWLFVLFLALVSSCVCLAQSNPPAPDPTQLAVAQAIREGRVTDAEKLLTDAVRELEQNDPLWVRPEIPPSENAVSQDLAHNAQVFLVHL